MAQEILEIHEINERLAELSALIFPEGLRLYYAHVDEFREQDVNPQSMPKKMFNQLVANIERDEAVESAPLCVEQEDYILIISGHHRIRAARAAGIAYILVYLYDELPDDRVYAKQLAHNQITGNSDPELVKEVWSRIHDAQAKFEAFVDPRKLKVPEPVSFSQVDVDVKALAKTAVITFLSTQHRDFEAAIERLLPGGEIDKMYVADKASYDAWRDAVQRVRKDLDIVSIPTAIAEMAKLAMDALDARFGEDD